MSVTSDPAPKENGGLSFEAIDAMDRDDTAMPRTRTWKHMLRSLVRARLAFAGALFVLLLVVLAILGDTLSPYSPAEQHLASIFQPPAFAGGDPAFLLGTDALGRDILSRIIPGARISLLVGIASVIVGGIAGVTLGILAGYFGGLAEGVIMRFVDLQLAFPTMFIGLIAMALLGTGITELIIVIAIVQWAYYARVARAETLKIIRIEYFQAAQALGVRTVPLILRHILPNAIGPLLVVASFSLSTAIFYEAALSFFGLGVPPNIPTWGNMLSDARNTLILNPWYPVFPGLAIMLTVLSFNLIGDWLRDYFDVTQND